MPKDSRAGRRVFGEQMERRGKEEPPEAEWKAIERGWCLGDEEFRAELLGKGESCGDHYGEDLRQADEEHALAILKRELKARGWKETHLIERRKGDPEKIKIAVYLKRETTMTLRRLQGNCKWEAGRIYPTCWERREPAKKNKSV